MICHAPPWKEKFLIYEQATTWLWACSGNAEYRLYLILPLHSQESVYSKNGLEDSIFVETDA